MQFVRFFLSTLFVVLSFIFWPLYFFPLSVGHCISFLYLLVIVFLSFIFWSLYFFPLSFNHCISFLYLLVIVFLSFIFWSLYFFPLSFGHCISFLYLLVIVLPVFRITTTDYHLILIEWQLDLQLPMQSVPITTSIVSSNPTQAKQRYAIKFVSDLRQVDGFLRVLPFPPPIKLTATI